MSDPDPVELLRNAAVLTDHPVDVGLRTEAVSVRPKMPSQIYLRVDPTRNGQLDGIHWAQDYELPA